MIVSTDRTFATSATLLPPLIFPVHAVICRQVRRCTVRSVESIALNHSVGIVALLIRRRLSTYGSGRFLSASYRLLTPFHRIEVRRFVYIPWSCLAWQRKASAWNWYGRAVSQNLPTHRNSIINSTLLITVERAKNACFLLEKFRDMVTIVKYTASCLQQSRVPTQPQSFLIQLLCRRRATFLCLYLLGLVEGKRPGTQNSDTPTVTTKLTTTLCQF